MHVHERDDQGFQFRYYNFFNGPKIIKIWLKFHQFFFENFKHEVWFSEMFSSKLNITMIYDYKSIEKKNMQYKHNRKYESSVKLTLS
jgi:hypothetical protein